MLLLLLHQLDYYNSYEGHSLCFAIWFVNNAYNHSVYSSFFEETLLSLYTFDHPLKPAVYDTRPRWLGYVQDDALEECSGIIPVMKQLPFDGMEQKPVTGG